MIGSVHVAHPCEARKSAHLRMTTRDHAAFSTFSTPPADLRPSSIDSNSALKLPSPKPSSPLRWMNSKKIGPIAFAEKICRQHFGVARRRPRPSPSIRMPLPLEPRDVLAVLGAAARRSSRNRFPAATA